MDDDRLLALDWPGIDFNGDGQFTLLDVPELAIAWLLFPGDAAIDLLLRYAPAVTEFFELGRNDLGGPVSLCLSAIFWFIALVAITLVVNAIRNLDRRMTAWCTGRIEAGRTALRVVWRRLSCWIGQMRRRREAKKELAAEDVATSLRCSLRNVKSALRTLLDYRLVEPAFGTDQGREGHQITRAGQIYLLER
jgi:hypothetical protein